MLQRSAKILLQNELRHTGTHNRMVEEAEMWRQKEKKSLSSSSSSSKKDKEKEKEKEKDKKNSNSVFFEDTRKSFLYDNRIRDDTVSYGKCRAHMDDEPLPLSTTRSTYWTRQLQKAEEKDPGRWGHSGYKELYPEEFRSDRSEDEENGHHHHHHHHHRKRSSRKRRKEKKHRHHYRSDDSRSDSEPRRKRRKSTGCSKHRKHRRSRELSSGSETVRYIRRKIRKERRRRKHKPRRMCDTDMDIKPQLITSNSPIFGGRRHRSVSSGSRRGIGSSMRDRSSQHDHRQPRPMSTDNSDSGAEEEEEAGSKRQKFQRDYSSSDSEDSYCMS